MEVENARSLPAKLTSLRKQKRITQMELAEKLNVSRQAISRWEVGAAVPSTDNLKVLSELYGVSVDYLLNDAAEEGSRQNEEKQDRLPPGEAKKNHNRRELYICSAIISVLLAIILVLTIVISSMANKAEQKQSHVLLIEDLTVAEEDDYTTYTFSLE